MNEITILKTKKWLVVKCQQKGYSPYYDLYQKILWCWHKVGFSESLEKIEKKISPPEFIYEPLTEEEVEWAKRFEE